MFLFIEFNLSFRLLSDYVKDFPMEGDTTHFLLYVHIELVPNNMILQGKIHGFF